MMFDTQDRPQTRQRQAVKCPAQGLAPTSNSTHSAVMVSLSSRKSQPDAKSRNAHWSALLVEIKEKKDRAAFKELFDHFAPRLKAFLMKQGADAAAAEDCMQEALVAVWHKSHLFDPARASAATWIFTIARNKRIDALRKFNRPEPDELFWGPQEEPPAEEVVAMQQENDKLHVALADLPQKQREMIQKAFFGELSHQEIADQTGLPLGTIKSRIRLALERLRHNLG